ncbi:hypothetical protein NDK43_04545 [Neobacillus pocheonensis]|uniref:Uncharacterized protein n=1 Tax=Neobacillus pocheonensis TaxID=363869 RepID=A0ABT0W632_9BACI|nr:hypothetical protein [Neobacillus pocheonensis]
MFDHFKQGSGELFASYIAQRYESKKERIIHFLEEHYKGHDDLAEAEKPLFRLRHIVCLLDIHF